MRSATHFEPGMRCRVEAHLIDPECRAAVIDGDRHQQPDLGVGSPAGNRNRRTLAFILLCIHSQPRAQRRPAIPRSIRTS